MIGENIMNDVEQRKASKDFIERWEGKVYEKNILGKNVLIIPIYHPSPINPKGYKNNLLIFEKIRELI